MQALLRWRRTSVCQVQTVSQIMRAQGLASLDLLKVDVERAELEVLQGVEAADWPRIAQVTGEVHDWQGRKQRVERLLRAHFGHVVVQQSPDLRGSSLYSVYCTREPPEGAG